MSLHGGTQMDRKQAARAVIFERRLLIACLWLAVLSLLTWMAAISTEYWYVSRCTGGGVTVETGIPGVTRASLLSGHGGLWKTCMTVLDNPQANTPGEIFNQTNTAGETFNQTNTAGGAFNQTNTPGGAFNQTNTSDEAFVVTACRNHEVFSIPQLPSDHTLNVLIGYWRTSLAFSVLSVLMQLLTIFFSWYSIRVPRYTFKRLTGCLYFISAGVKLVVIQIQDTAVEAQATLQPSLIVPGHCTWSYSFSFIMAFVCFIVNIVCAVCVFYTSGKKKKVHHISTVLRHDHTGDEDEPVIFAGR